MTASLLRHNLREAPAALQWVAIQPQLESRRNAIVFMAASSAIDWPTTGQNSKGFCCITQISVVVVVVVVVVAVVVITAAVHKLHSYVRRVHEEGIHRKLKDFQALSF